MRRLFLLMICCALLLCTEYSSHASSSITIDASTPRGEINNRILGYGLDYTWDAWGLWDPTTKAMKASGLDVVEASGFRPHAMLRFYGIDGAADTYHWRRGVGPMPDFDDEENNRPKNPLAVETKNNLGVDEMMGFVHDNWTDADVVIGVNWWGWNDPNADEYDPVKGKHEAANYVEYCNGSVDVPSGSYATVLLRAAAEEWQATTFVNEFGQPSTDSDAHEQYVSGHSWVAEADNAPPGYFAWLRYEFLTEVHLLDPDDDAEVQHGYGIKYWEIGNEVWLHPGLTASTYATGVHDYSVAMKLKDANIKVSACLDDKANLDTQLSSWDTTVLQACKDDIGFAVSHLYAHATDSRNSLYVEGSYSQMSQDSHMQSIYLAANTPYTFRIRASGEPRIESQSQMSDYPQLAAWLSPATIDGGVTVAMPQYPCTETWYGMTGTVPIAMTPKATSIQDDPRWYALTSGLNGYYACYPGVGQTPDYTSYLDSGYYGGTSDYLFTVTLSSAGYWIPWVTMPNNAGATGCQNARRIRVQMISYKETGSSSEEALVEFRTVGDKARAFASLPSKLADRARRLRQYIVGTLERPGIELGVTEFGYYVSPGANWGHIRSLHSGLVVADMLMEMQKPENEYVSGSTRYPCVDFGAYHNMNAWYFNIAQPEGYPYDAVHGCKWDGEEYSPDLDTFISSPVAEVYRLFNEHFGTSRLTADVTSDTFNSDAYGGVDAATDNSYLNAIASSTPSADGTYTETLYVMVVNKDIPGQNARSCPITIDRVPSEPIEVGMYVLKCDDTSPEASNLDAQNSIDDNDLISIATATSPGYTYGFDRTLVFSNAEFQAGTVTVLEITLNRPIASALMLPDDTEDVALQGKYVTAVFDDRFYIEEPLRTAGIAVKWEGTMPTVGQVAALTGDLDTEDGERVIVADTSPAPSFTSGTAPEAISMPNRSIGGGGFSANTPGITGAADLYNIGLLVQTWGVVTYMDEYEDYLYLQDGTAPPDGSVQCGIKVLRPPDGWPNPAPVEHDYLVVTGASSTSVIDEAVVRTLRARSYDEVLIRTSGLAFPCGQQSRQSSTPSAEEPAEGSIAYALEQPDDTMVTLAGVQITGDLGATFGVKDPHEALEAEPQLVIASTFTVKHLWTIDVVGVITTVNGQRSVTPVSILLYMDASSRPAPPLPSTLDPFGGEWPWKLLLE